MAKTFLNLPHGIEILIVKAAVDAEFKALLLERRTDAAKEIGLELTPTETAMLAAIPREQLEATIGQTQILPENRRVFLGKVAAAMLAALGVGETGCGNIEAVKTSREIANQAEIARFIEMEILREREERTRGIRPDWPNERIFFDYNQDDFRNDQKETLDRMVRNFLGKENLKFIIEGHADERGADTYTITLGRRRAEAVRDYFLKHGIARDRMFIVSKVEPPSSDGLHGDSAFWNRYVKIIKKDSE